MELQSLPYDMSFFINDRMQDEPTNPEEMKLGLQQILNSLSDITSEERLAEAHSTIGVFMRLLKRHRLSLVHLNKAMDYYDDHRSSIGFLTTSIRLAFAHQCSNNYLKADLLLNECLALCLASPEKQPYLDIVYQQFGRLRFDQGLYKESEEFFKKALFLRNQKGLPELMESTSHCLKIIDQLTL